MIVLGLTGSIGMGKSTAAAVLRRLGVPLYDADAEIHKMLGRGGSAVAAVEAAFPGVRDENGAIDRRRLGGRVFGKPEELRRLERILHPMVRAVERRWVARQRAHGAKLVVLDIPLLFETDRIDRVDGVIVVSAPLRLQRERVMRRRGMTAERFVAVLASQFPDREKRQRADFVVSTALSRAAAARQIAAIELFHHMPTGRRFHCYVNPERDMPPEAYAVHGLSAEFLADYPSFSGVIDDFLAFIGDDPLVIHNAEFDIAFLNAELVRAGLPPLSSSFVDTLSMARKRFPGAPASLDALCRRFTIDLAAREKHGAEIDCGLLADVYVELLGGRQPGLDFAVTDAAAATQFGAMESRPVRPPRPHAATAEELVAHRALLATITNPLWDSFA